MVLSYFLIPLAFAGSRSLPAPLSEFYIKPGIHYHNCATLGIVDRLVDVNMFFSLRRILWVKARYSMGNETRVLYALLMNGVLDLRIYRVSRSKSYSMPSHSITALHVRPCAARSADKNHGGMGRPRE